MKSYVLALAIAAITFPDLSAACTMTPMGASAAFVKSATEETAESAAFSQWHISHVDADFNHVEVTVVKDDKDECRILIYEGAISPSCDVTTVLQETRLCHLEIH